MLALRDGAGSVRLVVHNDDTTPMEFVTELLRTVFARDEPEALGFAVLIDQRGKAAFGPYPHSVAKAMIEEAQQRIGHAGHRLRITSEATGQENGTCDLCSAPTSATRILLSDRTACLCRGCISAIANATEPEEMEEPDSTFAGEAVERHFTGLSQHQLVTTTRQFPRHMRVDVQAAVDKLFGSPIRFFGLHQEFSHESLSFAQLMHDGRHAPRIAPAQYHEIDVGDDAPVKCLNNGLWLCQTGEVHYAALLSLGRDDGNLPVINLEIAVPAGTDGEAFVRRCFAALEEGVHEARAYRGKILSLESGQDYRGRARGIMVHKLPPVTRDEVILPDQTLRLLDRNVLNFIGSRDALRALGQSTRKGILLYGPPGTGKTHTIRYLASSLPGHTTLIITAEQVGLLEAYMKLARLLQPAMVVIEDVDLIARNRDEMGSPCEESLLNKLLNEMDGLRQDADILFVLTTNRPEELEGALAGRPGRIDQAIEVPLPGEAGRRKLVKLYAGSLPIKTAVIDEIVRRTQGVSAAFIKELTRRLVQSSLARDGGKSVITADIDEALDDMLFSGGRLNLKLLGAGQLMPS
jgi:ATP-dependent Clp protease adapter protein ClpS